MSRPLRHLDLQFSRRFNIENTRLLNSTTSLLSAHARCQSTEKAKHTFNVEDIWMSSRSFAQKQSFNKRALLQHENSHRTTTPLIVKNSNRSLSSTFYGAVKPQNPWQKLSHRCKAIGREMGPIFSRLRKDLRHEPSNYCSHNLANVNCFEEATMNFSMLEKSPSVLYQISQCRVRTSSCLPHWLGRRLVH